MFNNNNKDKIYFVAGGGTGGHIYPACAIMNTLLNNGIKNENIFYLGNRKNLEYEISKQNNFNFLSYSVKGMPRKLSFSMIIWLIGLFFATLKALFYALKYRPNVVFATGGYVCAPILFCAVFLHIPYVLHDCDIQPGIVTRFFSKWAKSVSLAFSDAQKYIKNNNVIINGNPIRHEFKTISKANARKELSLKDDFVIMIMGGSLGAKTINEASLRILKEYGNKKGFQIIWQTGKKNFDEVTKIILDEYAELPDNLLLQPYFDKMYLALLASDVVISRAGSLSLSEICACSLPSILIPYPYASQNHQKKNAECLVEKDAAIMLEDKDCNQETLFKTLENLIQNKELISNLSYNAYKLAKLDASNKIVEQINDAMTK